jgi:hypothetical protein
VEYGYKENQIAAGHGTVTQTEQSYSFSPPEGDEDYPYHPPWHYLLTAVGCQGPFPDFPYAEPEAKNLPEEFKIEEQVKHK